MRCWQVEFWTEMMKPSPSLVKLNASGYVIEGLTAECEANFRQQLELCPNSVQPLRQYAAFLAEVRAVQHERWSLRH